MTSLLLGGMTFAPNKRTTTSRNGFVRRSWMENLCVIKEESFKLCGKRNISSNGEIRVSIREQVGAHLINIVERKEQEKEKVVSDSTGITSFLGGKVFLITGATGFLAKAIVEKILRSASNVGKIYLLIKAKDKEAAMQRLESEVMNTELFNGLRETYGKSYQKFIMSKVVPVAGNVCESNLGMEVDVADHIAREVDIIINSAANTGFHERFDVSLEINTIGAYQVLAFAKRCNKLMLFLHVSTAYVNGERQGITKEKPFYKGDSIAKERAALETPASSTSFPLLDVEAEIKMTLDAKVDSEKMIELGLKRAKTYGWQDTYVFTKAMGEMLITNEREDIPVVIIRPSVIESSYKEPFHGWIEGIRMLDPLFVLYGKGQLTGLPGDAKEIVDIVPADMVVNATLAALVKHARMTKPGLSIYHIASSVANPLVIEDLLCYMLDYFKSSPHVDLKKKSPVTVHKMKFFSSMDAFNSHIEAAEVARRTNDAKAERRLQQLKHLATIYEPYTTYRGRFDSSNTEKLLEEMSGEDKMKFWFDVRSIDWKDYICNVHLPGIMKHQQKGKGMK